MQTNNNNTNLWIINKTKRLLHKHPSCFRIYSLCHHRTNIRKGFVVKAKKVEDDETQRRKHQRERDQRRSFPRKKKN